MCSFLKGSFPDFQLFGTHFQIPKSHALKGEKFEAESGGKKFLIRFSKDGEATGQIEGFDKKTNANKLFYLKNGKAIPGTKLIFEP